MLTTDANYHVRKTLRNMVLVNSKGKIENVQNISLDIIERIKKIDLTPTGLYMFSFQELDDGSCDFEFFFQVEETKVSDDVRFNTFIQFNDYISCDIYDDYLVTIEIGMKKILTFALPLGMEIASFPYLLGDVRKPDKLELILMFNAFKGVIDNGRIND